jgi:hypothetical protein
MLPVKVKFLSPFSSRPRADGNDVFDPVHAIHPIPDPSWPSGSMGFVAGAADDILTERGVAI